MKKAYTAPEAERIGFVSQQKIALDFDTLVDVAEGNKTGGVIDGTDPASSDISTNG